jgi:hypothetical protein
MMKVFVLTGADRVSRAQRPPGEHAFPEQRALRPLRSVPSLDGLEAHYWQPRSLTRCRFRCQRAHELNDVVGGPDRAA